MSLIGRFEHLPKRPKSDEARPLLEKIASQVKPIMAKRGWKVGTLAEFLPSNPALLGNNMNHGQRINLRLRPPGAESTFYEYDQLVLVMLHELTHIEHGPHDAKFYKLLAELEEEFYELKRKGYSGEGFHGAGHHLAGNKVPEHVGKAKGLAAAEKRLATSKVIGRGGALGGRVRDGRSMQEIIAEAAERRLRDDKTCQTGADGREVEEEVRKAQEESEGVDAVDLPLREQQALAAAPAQVPEMVHSDDSDIEIIEPPIPKAAAPITRINGSRISAAAEETRPIKKPSRPQKAVSATPATPVSLNVLRPARDTSSAKNVASATSLSDGTWACPTCTLINQRSALSCDACTSPKPSTGTTGANGSNDGWWCEFCGAGPREMGYWSCAECGWVRKWG